MAASPQPRPAAAARRGYNVPSVSPTVHRPSLRLAVLALPGLLAACASQPPARADGAPPVRVPPGCEASLAGTYFHRDVPPLRYAAEDDGRTLTLTLLADAADGGTPAAPDAGPGEADGGAAAGAAVQVTLVRTPEGFRGETRAAAYSPRGRLCPQVAFPTELVACDAAGTLRVRAAAEAYIDDDCRPSARPAPPMLEHVLQRGEPPAPDAGTP